MANIKAFTVHQPLLNASPMSTQCLLSFPLMAKTGMFDTFDYYHFHTGTDQIKHMDCSRFPHNEGMTVFWQCSKPSFSPRSDMGIIITF